MKKVMTLEMPDGSKWAIPLLVIAKNRALHYAHEFDGDLDRSLIEDTLPLFNLDPYEAVDWASGNMDWDDVKDFSYLLSPASEHDFNEAWASGTKEVIEVES